MRLRKRKGYALILAIMVAFFLGAITVSLVSLQSQIYLTQRSSQYREIALRAAEAAVERAIQRISYDGTFTTVPSGITEACWGSMPGSLECSYTYIVSGANPKTITASSKITANSGAFTIGQMTIQAVVNRGANSITIVSWDEL